MDETDPRVALAIALRRVLHGEDSPVRMQVTGLPAGTSDARLAAFTAWLQTLPAGAGEAALDALYAARWGPDPEGWAR